MICVSIACGSHTRMITEMKQLAEDNVDLIELRLDVLRHEPDFRRLLKEKKTPLIITIRRASEGGFWRDSEESRERLLRSAIIEGIEYIDLEDDTALKIPRYGKTKRIISYHNMKETPDLDEIYNRLLKGDPDIIKIAVMPKNINDVYRMLAFTKEKNKPGRKIPFIGICMSEFGAMTRILSKKYGAPYTYASFSKRRNIAPGMLYYKTLRDVYHYNMTNDSTEIYGVVADPISHSLSPLIHNKSFEEQGLNKLYLPFRVSKEDLEDFIQRSSEIDLRGLSVTIPHKVAIMKTLTQIGEAVREISACNTVIFKDGERIGFNTDYMAAILSIEGVMKVEPGTIRALHGKRAMVLGSGGAGKAVAFGLKDRGAHVIVTDGSGEVASDLATQLNCDCCPWEQRTMQKVDILANCTPIGMFPNVDKTPYDQKALRPGMIVFDAIYNPEFTWLIRSAKERGCSIVPGMEMFVGQAALQFKLFTGQKASIGFMRELVKNALAPVQEEEED